MTATPENRGTRKAKYNLWQERIENWKNSGLTQKQFCKEHQLKKSTFLYWHLKFNREKRVRNLLPVTITSDNNPPSSLLGSSGVSFCVNQRYTIQLAEQFNSQTLAKLIDFLEAQSCSLII